jgi:hypothetical protein
MFCYNTQGQHTHFTRTNFRTIGQPLLVTEVERKENENFTPEIHLAKQFKEAEERSRDERKIRFRFVERAGMSLKSILQKSDPWAGGKCGSSDCFPCRGRREGTAGEIM